MEIAVRSVKPMRAKAVTLVVSPEWGRILSRLQQLRNVGETTVTVDLRSLQVVSVPAIQDTGQVLRK